ncbi:hypothetical protein CPB97_007846 [Podila verticillata]|nr:hypothetical protein CPB97_007846 [Podila verticillata]
MATNNKDANTAKNILLRNRVQGSIKACNDNIKKCQERINRCNGHIQVQSRAIKLHKEPLCDPATETDTTLLESEETRKQALENATQMLAIENRHLGDDSATMGRLMTELEGHEKELQELELPQA